jgi:hypothetical protein
VASPPPARERDREAFADADLLFACALVWLAAAARVGLALARGEGFEGEATFTAGLVLILPWLLRGALAEAWRRARRGRCM